MTFSMRERDPPDISGFLFGRADKLKSEQISPATFEERNNKLGEMIDWPGNASDCKECGRCQDSLIIEDRLFLLVDRPVGIKGKLFPKQL